MIINEHLVVRKLAENEIRRAIKDFQNGRPLLRDCEWEEGGKNKTFADKFYNMTFRELDEKIIKNEIIFSSNSRKVIL